MAPAVISAPSVMPAQAGIFPIGSRASIGETPAFAGVTGCGSDEP